MDSERFLDGTRALVTGAAKRVGRATALALADHGADVVVHYRSSRDEAEDVARRIEARGRNAWTVQANLADGDAAESLVAQAADAAGPLGVLVNNASIYPKGTLASTTLDDLVVNQQVNAWSPLLLARAFADQVPDRGHVVNLLDTRITGLDPGHVAYYLSKRSFHAIHELLALDLAPRVQVNAVAPGPVLPPPGGDPSYLEREGRKVPLRRHGGPEDVVQAVLFLLRSRFVTGQVVFVDGGQHLQRPVLGREPNG